MNSTRVAVASKSAFSAPMSMACACRPLVDSVAAVRPARNSALPVWLAPLTVPAVNVDGAGGWSSLHADGGADRGAYSVAGQTTWKTAGTTITAVVATGAGNEHTGVSRLTVVFAVPTAVAATKV